jgi:hypothetical protein
MSKFKIWNTFQKTEEKRFSNFGQQNYYKNKNNELMHNFDILRSYLFFKDLVGGNYYYFYKVIGFSTPSSSLNDNRILMACGTTDMALSIDIGIPNY